MVSLAVSTTVYSAWINPQELTTLDDGLLSRLLGIKPKEISWHVQNSQHLNKNVVCLFKTVTFA